jgi:hypothetical protein
MAALGCQAAGRRLLVRLVTAAWMLAVASGASASSSASFSVSSSASSDLEYCSDEAVEKITSNPLVVKCSASSGYNFSSGVQPTTAQAEAICGSSCLTVFQTASLGSDDCVIPNGDHIHFLRDLVNYVLTICFADSGSTSGSTQASASSSTIADTSSPSDGGSSATPIAIGVTVAVVLLLALSGVFFWRKRRQRQKQDGDSSQFNTQGGYMPMLSDVEEIGRDGLLGHALNNSTGQSSHTETTATTASTASSAFSSKSRGKRARLSDLSPWRVDIESIQDIERLGHGAHGVVWRIIYRGTTVLASKRIQSDQVSQKRTQDFIDEIILVSGLQHPNIVAFIGVAWTMESDLQVLLEFMDAGDLRNHLLKPDTPKTWTLQKLAIAHDIVQALVYVHSFQPPLLHRDLKSHNVMLTTSETNQNDPRATMVSTTTTASLSLTAKLTDFGVSRFHSENNTMTIGVGTSRWLAPEVILGQSNYGPEADMYSFGVVLSELDTHELPYDDARTEEGAPLPNVAILQLVALGELKPSFSNDSSRPAELLSLSLRCLDHDGSMRPSAPQVAYELRKLMRALVAE